VNLHSQKFNHRACANRQDLIQRKSLLKVEPLQPQTQAQQCAEVVNPADQIQMKTVHVSFLKNVYSKEATTLVSTASLQARKNSTKSRLPTISTASWWIQIFSFRRLKKKKAAISLRQSWKVPVNILARGSLMSNRIKIGQMLLK
jgi:hypothetical protein